MFTRKWQDLLFVAVIVSGVVILSSWLVIGFDRVTAQARSNLPLFSNVKQDIPGHRPLAIEPRIDKRQIINLDMSYRDVYTQTANFPEGVELQVGRVEVVDDLQSAILGGGDSSTGIGTQSIKAGFEYIPPSAFRHDGNSPASGYRFATTGGYIRNNSSAQMCLAAPVYVPNGVTLTQFLTFFVDDSAASDLTVFLVRKNQAAPFNPVETVVSVTFPNTDESTLFYGFLDPFQTQPGAATISNNYGYSIVFCFDPNTGFEQRVYGFIVTYI